MCELTSHQWNSLSATLLLMPCVPGAANQGWNLSLSVSISCCGDKPLDCVLYHHVRQHYFLKDCGEMGKVTYRFPLLGKACIRVNTQASLIAIVITPFCTQLNELSANVRPNPCSAKHRVQVRSHLRGKCIPPEKQNKAHEDLKDPGKGQQLEFQASWATRSIQNARAIQFLRAVQMKKILPAHLHLNIADSEFQQRDSHCHELEMARSAPLPKLPNCSSFSSAYWSFWVLKYLKRIMFLLHKHTEYENQVPGLRWLKKLRMWNTLKARANGSK